jgi:iron complex transport system substrate-binding protein
MHHKRNARRALSLILLLATLAGSAWALAGSACAPRAGAPQVPTDDADAIRVVDAGGRTVSLPAPPQRIVVTGRGPYMVLHLLYMFPAARQRLVGVSSRGGSASDFLPLVDAAFAGVPVVAGTAGPEQLAALEPDLVLMKHTPADRTAEVLEPLGIPVVYLGLETPAQFFDDVALLGQVLDDPERAAEIAAVYRSRIERVEQAVADLTAEQRPDVLLAEYSDRGGEVAVQVPAASWMQTLLVETAGGDPVWLSEAEVTDGWTIVNFEQIAAWDPEQIFVIVWYTLDPGDVIARLEADPQWRQLRAVREGELYAFPADIYGWDNPEPRWLLGLLWLAKRMHPEHFADLDMEAQVRDTFQQLYGLDAQTVDEQILSRLDLDGR